MLYYILLQNIVLYFIMWTFSLYINFTKQINLQDINILEPWKGEGRGKIVFVFE